MRAALCLSAALLAAASMTGAARADQEYHSERLELTGLAGAPGGGMVVNVHADGPRIYARELYALKHAVPGTYVVLLNVFAASLGCSGPGSFSAATALLETNGAGNGQASFTFTPDLVEPFRGLTLSISWTITGPATYVSPCTVVKLA